MAASVGRVIIRRSLFVVDSKIEKPYTRFLGISSMKNSFADEN